MRTRLSGDGSKRLALGGGAQTAHELEVEIELNSRPFSRK